MKALVTGANGFLGSYVVRQLLEQNDEVRTLTRRPHDGLNALNVECFHSDIRDLQRMVRKHYVERAMREAGGVKAAAARSLGLTPQTFQHWARESSGAH